jgi:hypothetical protein
MNKDMTKRLHVKKALLDQQRNMPSDTACEEPDELIMREQRLNVCKGKIKKTYQQCQWSPVNK